MTQMTALSADQASVLQSLGYLYLQHGQLGRGLALLILADRCRPGIPTIMRTLAYAYLKNEEPYKALDVIKRIEQIAGAINPASPLRLMRAQALWLSGDKEEGRRIFARFNQARIAAQQLKEHGPSRVPALGYDDDEDDELILGKGHQL